MMERKKENKYFLIESCQSILNERKERKKKTDYGHIYI